MKDKSYIEGRLKFYIKDFLEENPLSDILNYALFPAGKLFRSQLIYSLSHDLKSQSQLHEIFAASIEIHHTYTLVHDDLPAMDNDDYRRGRKSTHKKYNEWKAILAGDALLALSFGLLSKITDEYLPELLSLYHKYTGASGLIGGQFLDLEIDKDSNKSQSLADLLDVHTLKTARLIQLSLLGANLISTNQKIDQRSCEKLGLSIGLTFQLIDDLTELTEDIGEHEKDINPFLRFDPNNLVLIIEKELNSMTEIFKRYELDELQKVISDYLVKMNRIITQGEERITTFLPKILVNRLKNIII